MRLRTHERVGVRPAPRKYPQELRKRAVRLVQAREQDPELSLNAAVVRIGPRVGEKSSRVVDRVR